MFSSVTLLFLVALCGAQEILIPSQVGSNERVPFFGPLVNFTITFTSTVSTSTVTVVSAATTCTTTSAGAASCVGRRRRGILNVEDILAEPIQPSAVEEVETTVAPAVEVQRDARKAQYLVPAYYFPPAPTMDQVVVHPKFHPYFGSYLHSFRQGVPADLEGRYLTSTTTTKTVFTTTLTSTTFTTTTSLVLQCLASLPFSACAAAGK